MFILPQEQIANQGKNAKIPLLRRIFNSFLTFSLHLRLADDFFIISHQ